VTGRVKPTAKAVTKTESKNNETKRGNFDLIFIISILFRSENLKSSFSSKIIF